MDRPAATGLSRIEAVSLLQGEGVETGFDLEALIGVAVWLEGILGEGLEGQVYRAGSVPSAP